MPRPNNNANMGKAKNFKKSALRFFGYCKKHMVTIIIAIVLSVVSTVFTLIGPDKLKEITNIISKPFGILQQTGVWVGIDINAVLKIAIFLVFIYGVGAICGYTQGFLMSGVTQKVSKKMRSDISCKINRLPLSYLDRTPYGDVLSRVTNDVDTVYQCIL